MSTPSAGFDVTVCVPTYNGARYIDQALASLCAQTFKGRTQVLVCDDASSDGTADLLSSALAKTAFSHRVVRNKQNLGLVGNWNQCLSLAEGTYIAFLFQDDWFEPDFLTKMVGCAEREGVSLVLCDRRYHFEPDTNPRQREFLEVDLPRLRHLTDQTQIFTAQAVSKMVFDGFLGPNFLGEPDAGLIRRSVVSELGRFDPELKQICDFEYWLRIATNGSIGFVPHPLINFRVHAGSTTNRNASTNASTIDRIILGYRFLSSPAYARLRELAPSGLLEESYSRYLQDSMSGRNYANISRSVPSNIIDEYAFRFKPSAPRQFAYWVQQRLRSVF